MTSPDRRVAGAGLAPEGEKQPGEVDGDAGVITC